MDLKPEDLPEETRSYFPEVKPWRYEPTAGWKIWVAAFALVGVVFCCGLVRARAGYDPDPHPAQQVAIHEPEPADDKMSWAEGLTAIGIFLAGVGGLAAWARSNRRRE